MFRDNKKLSLSYDMAGFQQSRGVPAVDGTDDREARPKFWIALYTRPRSEKKVKEILDGMGIETYLPIQKQIRQWSDRRKLVSVVVIPMTIFVNISKENLSLIISHPLILRPCTFPGSKDIAKIPVNQIDLLKFILGQSDYPVIFDTSVFQVNDKVRVLRGPLMGLTGEVINSDNNCLELAVSVGLGGVARLKIEKIDVGLL